jgi:sugar phosphate isomerase/epimerase
MAIYLGFQAPPSGKLLLEFAEKLKEYNFSWFEILAPESIDSSYENAIHTARVQLGYKVSVHARHLGIDVSAINSVMRNAALKIISKDLNYAQSNSAERFIMHAGDTHWYDVLPPNHLYYQEMEAVQRDLHQKHLTCLNRSVDYLIGNLENSKLILSIENGYCPWELLAQPDETEKFFNNKHFLNLGMTLDFGHAEVAGHSPLEFVNKIKPLIRHVHIHQNEDGYDLHLPINTIPEKWLISLMILNDSPQEVPMIFEWRAETIHTYIECMQSFKIFG